MMKFFLLKRFLQSNKTSLEEEQEYEDPKDREFDEIFHQQELILTDNHA